MGKITTKGTGDYNEVIEKLLRMIEGNYGTHKSANPVGSLVLSAIRARAEFCAQTTTGCRGDGPCSSDRAAQWRPMSGTMRKKWS
jgi:cytochrome b